MRRERDTDTLLGLATRRRAIATPGDEDLVTKDCDARPANRGLLIAVLSGHLLSDGQEELGVFLVCLAQQAAKLG